MRVPHKYNFPSEPEAKEVLIPDAAAFRTLTSYPDAANEFVENDMLAEGALKFPDPKELSNTPAMVELRLEMSLNINRYAPS